MNMSNYPITYTSVNNHIYAGRTTRSQPFIVILEKATTVHSIVSESASSILAKGLKKLRTTFKTAFEA